MLNFVVKAFRNFLEALLWLNLIIWTVGGGIIGYHVIYTKNAFFGDILPGAIIGIIIGLFLNIFCGGFIATILNIEKNTEQLLKK